MCCGHSLFSVCYTVLEASIDYFQEQFIFVYECLRHFITLEEDIDQEGHGEGMKRSISSFF